MPSRPSKCSATTHLEWTDSSLLYPAARYESIRDRLANGHALRNARSYGKRLRVIG